MENSHYSAPSQGQTLTSSSRLRPSPAAYVIVDVPSSPIALNCYPILCLTYIPQAFNVLITRTLLTACILMLQCMEYIWERNRETISPDTAAPCYKSANIQEF